MASNLRARLGRIRSLNENPVEIATVSKGKNSLPEPFPDGWKTLSGGLRFRESLEPFMGYDPETSIKLAMFSRRLADKAVKASGLLFFDLETTGLSGGAGTVAFLAAFGSIRNSGYFSVPQYFIDDYPAEPAFLEALSLEFSDAQAVVSYNGSSFDMPLHSVRRSMNGLGPLNALLHVDVLHACRRLWRPTLVDCSLGNIESNILGVLRTDDIPGAEVPAVWFDYIKRGHTRLLSSVFSHNEVDVRSLARLFFKIMETSQGLCLLPRVDSIGLGELQSRIDPHLAELTYRNTLESGDSRAVRPLLRLYRGMGRLAECSELIPMLPDDAPGLFSRSVHAQRCCGDTDEALRLAVLAEEKARKGSTLATRIQKRVDRLSGMLLNG